MVEEHFLPIAQKIQTCALNVELAEKKLSDRRVSSDNSDLEGELQQVCTININNMTYILHFTNVYLYMLWIYTLEIYFPGNWFDHRLCVETKTITTGKEKN